MHKQKRIAAKSYFEITEDPPYALPSLRKTHRTLQSYKLPKSNFFFIDFTEECQLRLMKKMNSSNFGASEPLSIEQFGKNIVINVEDSSPHEGQLVKCEEQHRSLKERKHEISSKVKESLARSKQQLRSKSVMAIKQELIEEYNKPVKPAKKQPTQPLPSLYSDRKMDLALKRLGLGRE